MQKEKEKKKSHSYLVQKRRPTQLNYRVQPLILESVQKCYFASGNTINVYCLQSGQQIGTLRKTNKLNERCPKGQAKNLKNWAVDVVTPSMIITANNECIKILKRKYDD